MHYFALLINNVIPLFPKHIRFRRKLYLRLLKAQLTAYRAINGKISNQCI